MTRLLHLGIEAIAVLLGNLTVAIGGSTARCNAPPPSRSEPFGTDMALSVEEQREIVRRSDTSYYAGDITTAMAALKPLVDQQTDYFRPYHNLGFFCWLRADYVQAERYLAQALHRAPRNADTHLLLGKVRTVLRRYPAALDHIAAYLAMGGSSREALLWQSRALWGDGKPAAASEMIARYAEESGWPTPRRDKLHFAQEPWFLSHIPNWRKNLQGYFGRIRNALEIGSMEGMSSVWIAEHMLVPDGKITINDLAIRPNLAANLERSRFRTKFVIAPGDSAVILPTLPAASYDFIYVDGDHSATGVFRDCVNAAALASRGAMVILDDYGKANERTRDGIDLFLLTIGKVFDVVEKGYQVFLTRNALPFAITSDDMARIASSTTVESARMLRGMPPSVALAPLRSGAAKLRS